MKSKQWASFQLVNNIIVFWVVSECACFLDETMVLSKFKCVIWVCFSAFWHNIKFDLFDIQSYANRIDYAITLKWVCTCTVVCVCVSVFVYFVLVHYDWFVGALVCSVYLYYKDLTSKQPKVNAICQMHKVKSYYKNILVCVCVDLFHISLLLQLQKDQQAKKKTSTNK